MAVAIPVLVDYARPTATVGQVHADNVPALTTCRAYYITILDSPPAIAEAGSAVGDGNPNLEIDLDLTGATWDFFGLTVPKPISVFLLNDDAGDFSAPSVKALPQIIDLSPHAIEIKNLRRVTNDLTKIQFVVEGLPDDTYKIYMAWVSLTGDIAIEIITGNGFHVLTAAFDPTWPYSFLGIPQAPDGTFLAPVTASEDFTTLTVDPPVLDRILTEDGDRQMEVYWTPPTDQRVSSFELYYRNKSRNEPNWNVVVATSSPVVITDLKRGNVYEVMMISQDGVGRTSLPTQVLDIFVRG
jgi:hypothetical protein